METLKRYWIEAVMVLLMIAIIVFVSHDYFVQQYWRH